MATPDKHNGILRKIRRLQQRYLTLRYLPETKRLRNLYLALMQDCLTGRIYEDPPLPVLRLSEFEAHRRELGLDWPSVAHTMIGRRRMANLRHLVENVILHRIPGDLIETGVWRGGACIYMRAILKAYDIRDRRVWVADSFKGLPEPDPEQYPADKGDSFHTYRELAVPQQEVERNFQRYGLLDGQVVFLKGWFKDTLPTAPIQSLAILRLDGDMYESTMDALESLYGKLSVGGFVIVDDYHAVESCRKAVDEFRLSRDINDRIEEIDGTGVYWQKWQI
jgi:hypothetical protein